MSGKQKSLFEELAEDNNDGQKNENVEKFSERALIHSIQTPKDKREIKLIKDFKSRIRKLQKVTENKKRLIDLIDSIRVNYYDQISDIKAENAQAQYDFVVKLDSYYTAKGLTKNERELLKRLVQEKCEFLMIEYQMDCRHIIKKYFDQDIANNQEAKDEILEMLGGEVPEDFDIEDTINLSSEEFMKKYAEFFHQKRLDDAKEAANEKSGGKKDEDFDLDFKRMFKNLSKNLHPDREKDPDLRQKKEAMMKELNQAKKEKDIFKLLILQDQVSEGFKNEFYTIAQVKAFSQRLLEQIKRIESDIWLLKYGDDEGSFLYETFFNGNPKVIDKKIKEFALSLREETVKIKEETKGMKTKKFVKGILAEYELLINEDWDFNGYSIFDD